MKNKILIAFKRTAWAPITVFLVHVFIYKVLYLYNRFPSLDILAHFLGGLVIAYFLYAIFEAMGKNFINLSVFMGVGTTTVFWEFLEFLTKTQGAIADTMLDMLIGLLGAVAFLFLRSLGQSKGDKRRV